jgi:hypothetical protein
MKRSLERYELEHVLSGLIGRQVLAIGAGGSTGSIFTIDFSGQFSEGNETDQNCDMMVKCSWRLDDIQNSSVITGWQEDSDIEGVMTVRLKSLVNDVVKSIQVSEMNDLHLYFKSEKKLFVFCDITPFVTGDFNWFLKNSAGYYSVGTDLKCIFSVS